MTRPTRNSLGEPSLLVRITLRSVHTDDIVALYCTAFPSAKHTFTTLPTLKVMVLQGYFELSESLVHFSIGSKCFQAIEPLQPTPNEPQKKMHGGCIFFFTNLPLTRPKRNQIREPTLNEQEETAAKRAAALV